MRLLPPTPRNTASRRLLAAVLPAMIAATTAARAQAQANPMEQAADAALADRFEGLAELTFPAKVPSGADRPYVFAEQAALLRAAGVLDPGEVRYPLKLAEALSDVGDIPGQQVALTAAVDLRPSDEFTWIKLLDSHLAQFQAADRQKAYLQGIETAPVVPPDVAAYAYARHAQILYDQGREGEARKLLPRALQRNPLDIDALRLTYRLLPPTAAPSDRLRVLLALLKANPLQPYYAHQVGLIAADAGLVQESLSFFALGVNTSYAQRRPDLGGAVDWASELYVSGQSLDAYRFVEQLLSSNPNISSAWYLKLLVGRSSGVPAASQAKDLQQATIVMSNRVAELLNALAAAGGPTSRPATSRPAPGRATTRPMDAEGAFPLPDVSAAAALLKDSDDVSPQARREFIDAVSDLARLEIYFAKRPDLASPLMDALRAVLPANDALLAQLQGLASLVAGDTKGAADTLAGVARDDPLSAMGLILAQWKDHPSDTREADAAARKLVQDHPDGLVGAFLFEALVNPRVRLLPKASQQLLQQQLQLFPSDLFNLASRPSSIYSIHVEAVAAGRQWGQPLLAKITLFNTSGTDLTLGENGMIRPGLLFQMTPVISGVTPTSYPAFDTLSGPLVLRPHEETQQVVRVDQSALIGVLQRTVRVMFQIDGQAVTNPDTGVAGYAARLDQPFARTAVNAATVGAARGELNGAGANGVPPRDRLTAVGLVQAYVREMRAVRNQPPAVLTDLEDLRNTVHRAFSGEQSPAVAAWAGQADFALASDPAAQAATIHQLAGSPDWRQRQLALVLVAATRDLALQKAVVDGLTADPQPSVAEYAKAAAALLKMKKPMNALAAPPAAPAAPAADAHPTAPTTPSQPPTPAP